MFTLNSDQERYHFLNVCILCRYARFSQAQSQFCLALQFYTVLLQSAKYLSQKCWSHEFTKKSLAHKIFRLYGINLLLQLSSDLQIIIIYKFQKNCFFSGSIYGACGSYTTTVIYCYCYGCFAQMFNEDDILGISLN